MRFEQLFRSNSISVPIGIFKSNGISGVISSIKAKYICKSPKCFPKQYNSCIKITCALNQADLHNQKWRKIQVSINYTNVQLMFFRVKVLKRGKEKLKRLFQMNSKILGKLLRSETRFIDFV